MLDMYLYIVLVTLSVAITGSYVNTNISINNKIKETNDNMVTKINDSIKQLENIDIIQLQNYQTIIDRITAGSININTQIQLLEDDIKRLDNNDNINGSIANNIKTALIPINDKITILNGTNTTVGSVSNTIITNPQFVDLTTKTNNLKTQVDILNGNSNGSILKMIEDSIASIKNDIIKLNGNISTQGSVSNIVNTIINPQFVDLTTKTNTLTTRTDTLTDKMDKLNGNSSTQGSVSDSINKFVTPLINTVNTDIANLKTIPTGGCINNYIQGPFPTRQPVLNDGTSFSIPKTGNYILNLCASAQILTTASMIILEVFIDGQRTNKQIKVWANETNSHKTLIPLSFTYRLTEGNHFLFLSQANGYSDINDFASFNWVFASE